MEEPLALKDIDTDLWYRIIAAYKASGWKTEYEYDQFDKGIDHDFYRLSRNGEVMLFSWDNWTEGEILCSEERRSEMEARLNVSFQIGEPFHLRPDLIELEREVEEHQKKRNWWRFWKW